MASETIKKFDLIKVGSRTGTEEAVAGSAMRDSGRMAETSENI
jgi:hypothetical protein